MEALTVLAHGSPAILMSDFSNQQLLDLLSVEVKTFTGKSVSCSRHFLADFQLCSEWRPRVYWRRWWREPTSFRGSGGGRGSSPVQGIAVTAGID